MTAAPSPETPDAPFEALAQAAVLIVDDEPGMRNFLARILGPRCRRVEMASSAAEATRRLDAEHFDVILLDNVMPEQRGLDWLAEQRRVGLFSDAILMTAYAELDTAIEALRAGATDFVLKPFRSNQILNAVARSMDRATLRRENFLLRHELAAGGGDARGRLLGASPKIEEVRRMLDKLAPLPTPVLIRGETGAGKEVAARAMHAASDRAGLPFVAVNCAALSAETAAAELFGAVSGREGLMAHAAGGTLFLDEIADLPFQVQGALLRVIEENRIRPVGSERETPLSLRFVFASNADLEAAVAEKRFRADLFHRINVVSIHMPPLRERIGDIEPLAQMFMGRLSRELGAKPLTLTEPILLRFARYDWPGNVRELRNLIERALILREFPPDFGGEPKAGPAAEPTDSLQAVERRHILAVLEAAGGNRAEAARRLGVSRKTIDRKCAMWDV
ncbi:sigma-54-dependent transcriptional regulator [Rhodovulum sp. DZ06]|uniref:sigma-54-dependent transcriptional regulator n=1 Tax=Rhodovulum sp. DZ06 TaxID=3425126 RepID=UPI003D3314E1